jgi:hypothetical protein
MCDFRRDGQRDTFRRATTITSSEPCAVDEGGLTFELRLAAQGSWTTELDVAIEVLTTTEDDGGSTLAWRASVVLWRAHR